MLPDDFDSYLEPVPDNRGLDVEMFNAMIHDVDPDAVIALQDQV